MFVPNEMFLTKGVGVHKEKLASFEAALRDAGIAEYNLVQVSSIFPPRCKMIPRAQGLKRMQTGAVTFAVISRAESNENRRLLAASVGVAIPKDSDLHGYLSEHHSFGQNANEAGDYAEDLAASMLCSTIGVDYDSQASYDEKKEIWKISGKIVRTSNITQSAICRQKGMWTTVLAAAVLLFD